MDTVSITDTELKMLEYPSENIWNKNVFEQFLKINIPFSNYASRKVRKHFWGIRFASFF